MAWYAIRKTTLCKWHITEDINLLESEGARIIIGPFWSASKAQLESETMEIEKITFAYGSFARLPGETDRQATMRLTFAYSCRLDPFNKNPYTGTWGGRINER